MAVKSLLRQLGPLTLSRGLQGPTNVLASRLVVETDTTGLTAQGLLRRLASSHTPAGQRASSGIRKHVLYQGRWMVPFRVLVRLKIFQLSGIAACAIPLGTFLSEGGVSLSSLGVAGALLIGCGTSASTLNYYSRRYVGELSLITRPPPSEAGLCFSVLDFWGRREDNVVPLSSLVPPLRDLPPDGLREMASQPLIPVQVDGERQFYLSLRFGIFADKAALVKVLQGTHELQNTEE